MAPDDPDRLVHQACFLPIATAVDLVRQGPYGPMSASLASYLSGATPPGSAWFWRLGESSDPVAVVGGETS